MNICSKCKVEKYRSDFGNGTRKDGSSSWCKQCLKDYNFSLRTFKEITDLDGEIWIDIIGYEGLYKLSNLSRVKSLKKEGVNNGAKSFKDQFLVKQSKRCGYNKVRLIKNGDIISYSIHRLIAEHFIPNPENKPHVNHIDKNRVNNSIENLEWVNSRENTSHSELMDYKTSKYIGVSWDKRMQKWTSNIQINGKRKFLGNFFDEDEAGMAYKNALIEHGLTNKYA